MESVHSQTYTDFQYIIIDGNSADESMEIVSQFYFKDFLISSEPDDGIYDAMNKGIQKATGEYLIFMNSGDSFYDDISLDLISKNILNDTSVDIFYGNFFLGSELVILPTSINISFLRGKGSICHQATATRRGLLINLEGFNLQYKISSDLHFFIRSYLEKANFKYINEPLVKYITGGISSTFEAAVERKSMFMKTVPLYLRVLNFSYYLYALKWHYQRRFKNVK